MTIPLELGIDEHGNLQIEGTDDPQLKAAALYQLADNLTKQADTLLANTNDNTTHPEPVEYDCFLQATYETHIVVEARNATEALDNAYDHLATNPPELCDVCSTRLAGPDQELEHWAPTIAPTERETT